MSSISGSSVICPVCSTGFARKAHLARHLRSHLNQRSYVCSNCNKAAFTRSDLLTRHSKRCVNKSEGKTASRKRSCESCIQRKVKCDLKKPCSRCELRGDKCIYDIQVKFDSTSTDRDPLDEGSSSSVIQSATSQISQEAEENHYFHIVPSNAPLDTVSSVFASPIPDAHFSWPSFVETNLSSLTDPPPFSFTFPENFPQASAYLDELEFPSFDLLPTSVLDVPPSVPRPLLSPGYYAEEATRESFAKQKYIYNFIRQHCAKYPFLHVPTWREEATHPLLLKAMTACGALYTARRLRHPSSAKAFMAEIFQSDIRQEIFRAFVSLPGTDLGGQLQLFLAMMTIQILGLFHWDPLERSVSAGYHVLAMNMFRQSGLLDFYENWQPPSVNMLSSEETWVAWAMFETTKRLMLLSYLHDSLMPTFYSLPCVLAENEFDLRFPCNDVLWVAGSAPQWALLAITTGACDKLRGSCMADAISTFFMSSTPQPPTDNLASFLLIHVFLRLLHNPIIMDNPNKRMGIKHALEKWYARRSTRKDAGMIVSPGPSNFTCVALPLYWFALSLIEAKSSHILPCTGEQNFDMVRRWLWDFWPVLRVDEGESPEDQLPSADSHMQPPGDGILDWVPDLIGIES